jgi:mono/diheme cytochrome c family protein
MRARSPMGLLCGIGFLGILLSSCGPGEPAEDVPQETAGSATNADPVARGGYLVRFGGCNDCHTPKTMTATGPVADTTRLLSGHPAGSELPAIPAGVVGPEGWDALAGSGLTAWAGPWGVSFTANLTPDTTGLGIWTEEQFIQTMRTGRHWGVGRPILPPMPWYDVGSLTDEDLRAVFAYLRSLRPIRNQVPAPIPPAAAAVRQ